MSDKEPVVLNRTPSYPTELHPPYYDVMDTECVATQKTRGLCLTVTPPYPARVRESLLALNDFQTTLPCQETVPIPFTQRSHPVHRQFHLNQTFHSLFFLYEIEAARMSTSSSPTPDSHKDSRPNMLNRRLSIIQDTGVDDLHDIDTHALDSNSPSPHHEWSMMSYMNSHSPNDESSHKCSPKSPLVGRQDSVVDEKEVGKGMKVRRAEGNG